MSGSASAGTFAAALEVVDPSHLLWGSDFPANRNLAGSLNVVRSSELSDAQKLQILGNNFSDILPEVRIS